MKVCLSCGHLTADEAAATCPSCGRSELATKEAPPLEAKAAEATEPGAPDAGRSPDAGSRFVPSSSPAESRPSRPTWAFAAAAIVIAAAVAVGTYVGTRSQQAADAGTAASAQGDRHRALDGGR